MPQLFLQGQTEVKFFLHNHLRFTILYHKDAQTDLARIVGFEVEPFSVKHDYEPPWDKASPILNTCNPGRMIYVTHNLPPQPVQEGVEVIFSYDVKFVVRTPACPGFPGLCLQGGIDGAWIHDSGAGADARGRGTQAVTGNPCWV